MSKTQNYIKGEVELAEFWIARGGALDAHGPEDANEEVYNGFLGRLADERRSRDKSSQVSPDTHPGNLG